MECDFSLCSAFSLMAIEFIQTSEISALFEVYLISMEQLLKWKCLFFVKLQISIDFTHTGVIHTMTDSSKNIHENRVNYLNPGSRVWFISPDTLTASEVETSLSR